MTSKYAIKLFKENKVEILREYFSGHGIAVLFSYKGKKYEYVEGHKDQLLDIETVVEEVE